MDFGDLTMQEVKARYGAHKGLCARCGEIKTIYINAVCRKCLDGKSNIQPKEEGNGWVRINKTMWEHPSGIQVRIKLSSPVTGGYDVVFQVDDNPSAIIEDTVMRFEDAERLALEFIKENPNGK